MVLVATVPRGGDNANPQPRERWFNVREGVVNAGLVTVVVGW
jgi:hypothetical protein